MRCSGIGASSSMLGPQPRTATSQPAIDHSAELRRTLDEYRRPCSVVSISLTSVCAPSSLPVKVAGNERSSRQPDSTTPPCHCERWLDHLTAGLEEIPASFVPNSPILSDNTRETVRTLREELSTERANEIITGTPSAGSLVIVGPGRGRDRGHGGQGQPRRLGGRDQEAARCGRPVADAHGHGASARHVGHGLIRRRDGFDAPRGQRNTMLDGAGGRALGDEDRCHIVSRGVPLVTRNPRGCAHRDRRILSTLGPWKASLLESHVPEAATESRSRRSWPVRTALGRVR